MNVYNVIVKEQPNDWSISWLEWGRTHRTKTAAKALAYIQRKSAEMAKTGKSNAVIIAWLPSTEMGRGIVLALQQ